jgi:hypothetical protein
MASPFATSVLPVPRPEDDKTRLPAVSIDLSTAIPTTTVQDGAAVTEMPDGSVRIDLSGRGSKPAPIDDKFHANLAVNMDDGELATITTELPEGIKRDDESRSQHLEMIAEGIKLLGLVIETTTTTSVTETGRAIVSARRADLHAFLDTPSGIDTLFFDNSLIRNFPKEIVLRAEICQARCCQAGQGTLGATPARWFMDVSWRP